MKEYNNLSEESKHDIVVFLKNKIKEYQEEYGGEVFEYFIVLDKGLLEELLFNKKEDGCLFFRNDIKDLLGKFDLSMVSFKDVFVSGQDFTGTNAKIDPQLVWNKNMCYGIYPLDFTGKSFENVKVDGANFYGAVTHVV